MRGIKRETILAMDRRELLDFTVKVLDEEAKAVNPEEKRYLDVLDFLSSTKMLYRILLKRTSVKRHTLAEIRNALYQMDDVCDKLTRNSSLPELDAAYEIIKGHFNNYSSLSNRTRNRR